MQRCWWGLSLRERSDSDIPSPSELWVTTTWTLPPETLASSRANQGSCDGEMAGPPGQHSMAFSTICSSSSLRGICSKPAAIKAADATWDSPVKSVCVCVVYLNVLDTVT